MAGAYVVSEQSNNPVGEIVHRSGDIDASVVKQSEDDACNYAAEVSHMPTGIVAYKPESEEHHCADSHPFESDTSDEKQ